MFDLTPAFKEAARRAKGWDRHASRALVDELAKGREDLRGLGGGIYWHEVGNDHEKVALVYTRLPLVIAEPDFAKESAEILKDVVVVPHMTSWSDDIFSFDPSQAKELLSYPAEDIDLDFDAFSAWDFWFETM